MRSNACEMGQHEDCGGNGDMLGCTCDCHVEPDPELGCTVCGCPLDPDDDFGICFDCADDACEESYQNAREASPEDALTHDQLTADREYRATRPLPFNG